MCFSAGASFGASVVIASIGGLALKNAKTPAQRIFSMIPILFAIQQFSEGLIWLDLSSSMGPPPLLSITAKTYIYLLFAWVVWPSFLPYSFFLLENDRNRKIILKILIIIGLIISTLLSYTLVSHNVIAQIANHHIKYLLDFTPVFPMVFGLLYLSVTIFSCFISSIKGMWYLGIMNLGSFIFSKLIFNEYLISVWCYFAALSSIGVLVILHQLTKQPQPHKSQANQKLALNKDSDSLYP